jgi:hypothetical protein
MKRRLGLLERKQNLLVKSTVHPMNFSVRSSSHSIKAYQSFAGGRCVSRGRARPLHRHDGSAHAHLIRSLISFLSSEKNDLPPLATPFGAKPLRLFLFLKLSLYLRTPAAVNPQPLAASAATDRSIGMPQSGRRRNPYYSRQPLLANRA